MVSEDQAYYHAVCSLCWLESLTQPYCFVLAESLIVFFTHDWNLSLKQLYAAEWIVFSVSIKDLFCF